ncbi:MAG: hypothetical protein K2F66_07250 [Duncaniella sp.]|nr:hypothetical protein [Duncaniella sp.]
MKKLTLLMVTAIFAVLHVYGVQPVYERIVKLSYPSEKEKKIIDVARKVCDEVAPGYKVETLEPVIYDFPVDGNHPVIDRKAIAVKYMRSVDDYCESKVSELKSDKNCGGKVVIKRSPRFVVEVVMFEDTLEPLFIMDGNNRSIGFQPSYSEYRRLHPNDTLEP